MAPMPQILKLRERAGTKPVRIVPLMNQSGNFQLYRCSRQCFPVVVALLLLVGTGFSQEKAETDDWKVVRQADWQLLDFVAEYRITKVKIEVRKTAGRHFTDGSVIASFSSAEPKLLNEFQKALATARIPTPRRGDGGFGITPTALLEFETTKGPVRIYCRHSFLLNQESHAYHVAFKSMGLAVLVDRVLREQGFDGLPAEDIDHLSGELALRLERKRFSGEE